MMILKFILAMLPIIWLVIALSGLKMPGFKACGIALVIAVVLGISFWKMTPINAATACLEGFLMAIWPIGLVIIAAVFTYNLTLETKAMDVMKKMLTSVSNDKRVLVLIIAWGFGGFMEGMAGFGTAVAIPAGMLVGLGMNPIFAACVCLVANATPTAFGSVGIPTVTLGTVTGIDSGILAATTSTQLAILMILTPFIMVSMCGKGVKALKGMLPTILVSALSFVVPAWFAAHFIGAELPVILGSICSMLCTILVAHIFNKNTDPEFAIETEESEKITTSQALKAWMPFILIFCFLLVTSKLVAPINQCLSVFKTSVLVYAGEGGSPISFSWINTPGVWIFLSAFIGGIVQGASIGTMLQVLKKTLINMSKTIITILSVMGTAKLMGYSGMISDIATMFVTVTGSFYPLFAPLIGGIGTFVTGSGTSASVLFGGLQAQTAQTLGVSEAWMASANTMGACIGKMISPQSIAIAVGAINLPGSESSILKTAIKYCVLFLCIAGLIAFIGTKITLA